MQLPVIRQEDRICPVWTRILYIADYIEPGRRELPNMADVRKMAFQDLDRMSLQNFKRFAGIFKQPESSTGSNDGKDIFIL